MTHLDVRDSGKDALGVAPPARIVARHRGLVARTLLVSGLTFLSRLLGFAREALMAFVFGDRSAISDAFYTAWQWPNLFRRLLGEGALSTSLQAAMTRADAEHGDEAGRALFLRAARLLSAILVLLTLVGMVLALLMPDRVPGTSYAWLGELPAAVRDLTVRLLPYVLLICLTAVCGGALAVRGHFAIPNLAPTLMNLIWIGTLVAIGYASDWGRAGESDRESATNLQWAMARWLAWGLLLGGLVQFLVHLPPLARYGLIGRSALDEESKERVNEVLRTMVPLVVGAAVYQLSVLIDGIMAQGLLETGGRTALYYANRLQQFPLAMISTAAVSAVFPSLNAHGHLRELARVRGLHDRTQLAILFLALPSAAGMFALASPLASVCYEHGNYGPEGAARVAEGLRCLAFALVPAGAAALAGRAYIAMGDFRTPVRISIWTLSANAALNAMSVLVFGLDVAGLTLATAITSWANLAWLVVGLHGRLGLPRADPSFAGRVVKQAVAAGACGLAAWATHRTAAWALDAADPRRSITALFAGIGAGALAYVVIARALGVPEWDEIVRRLARRLGRT